MTDKVRQAIDFLNQYKPLIIEAFGTLTWVEIEILIEAAQQRQVPEEKVEVVTVEELMEKLKTYTDEDTFIAFNYLANTYYNGVKIINGAENGEKM